MRQIKFTEEKLGFIIDTVNKLVGEIRDKNNKQAIERLMGDLGDRYFESPASPCLSFHNCCVGGLSEHSLRVYGNLKKLCETFAVASGISHDSIIITALFHDLGKIGSIDTPYYLYEDDQWQQEKRGQYYKTNPDIEFLGVAQRSLRILTHYGVNLTEDEYKAILLHDGQYIPENAPYAHKEGWLGLLLHQADIIACKTEHEKWKSLQ